MTSFRKPEIIDEPYIAGNQYRTIVSVERDVTKVVVERKDKDALGGTRWVPNGEYVSDKKPDHHRAMDVGSVDVPYAVVECMLEFMRKSPSAEKRRLELETLARERKRHAEPETPAREEKCRLAGAVEIDDAESSEDEADAENTRVYREG
jgi:hypothetical protein